MILNKLDHKSLGKPKTSITYQFVLYLISFMFDDIIQVLQLTTDILTCKVVPTLIVELFFIITFTTPVLYILYANHLTLK